MRIPITFLGVMIIVSGIFSSCEEKKTEEKNSMVTTTASPNKTDIERNLRAANDSLYAALNAMFIGNMTPMDSVWSHSDDITDMGPFGGRLMGWNDVYTEFNKEAGMKLGGKVVCNDVVVHAGTDVGYTVCVEEGENMSAAGKPVKVSHRATNIFRLENGRWKLVHHHTDLSLQLQKAIDMEKK